MAADNDIFRELGERIQNSNLNEEDKRKFHEMLIKMKSQKINLMITGGTGVGKSSTINALFGREISKVGIHAEPETMEIKSYELNENITLWDSPGLGDGMRDAEHARKIVDLLHRKDSSGAYMIDLVLVLADATSRDLGTTYSLISDVIVPNLGDENDKKTRIIAALNKCDAAMGGRHWDYTNSKPDEKLVAELDGRADSFRRRVKETTGVDVDTMYYSAGYKDDDNAKQEPSYNLAKLLSLIISHTPVKKRVVIIKDVSRNKETWKRNDGKYGRKMQEDLSETVRSYISEFANIGGSIGDAIMPGGFGRAVGSVIGGVVGAVADVCSSVMSGIGNFIGGLFGGW